MKKENGKRKISLKRNYIEDWNKTFLFFTFISNIRKDNTFLQETKKTCSFLNRNLWMDKKKIWKTCVKILKDFPIRLKSFALSTFLFKYFYNWYGCVFKLCFEKNSYVYPFLYNYCRFNLNTLICLAQMSANTIEYTPKHANVAIYEILKSIFYRGYIKKVCFLKSIWLRRWFFL